MSSRTRLSATAAVAAVAAVIAAFALTRAGDEGAGLPLLVDGSRAGAPPARLDLAGDAALVRARVLRVPSPDRVAGVRSCLRLAGVAGAGGFRALEMVGLLGRSLTFHVEQGRGLAACEASARRREPRAGPWCGAAYGRLGAGRLGDGRLTMVNCLDAEGRPVAFGWIEPLAGARWLTVRDGGAAEVYPVVAGYPVRVTTREVDTGAASALFHITQHADDGRKLAERTLEMRVAG